MGKTSKPKLGKPQRSKKHKKIKAVDPFYVGPRSVDRTAGLVNLEPKKDTDDDYLPGSIKEMKWLQQQADKAGGKQKRPKNKFKKDGISIPEYKQDPLYLKKEKGMTRPLKAVPSFTQKPGESEIAFMYRMDRETQQVLRQAQFEDKYEVDIEETESGDVKVTKHKDILAPMKDKKMEKKKKKKNQRKAEKMKEYKEEKLKEQIDNFEEFTDRVEFGEVAMAPPLLSAKPRKVDEKTNRPGTKSLLLKDMMSHGASPSRKTIPSQQREVGKSLKRKQMSLAEQRILDGERERAIELYRKIKKQKMGD